MRRPSWLASLLAAALSLGAASAATFTDEADVAIPDAAAAGVTRFLTVSPLTIRSMTVSVEITHTARGDLEVELRSPQGTVVPLHLRKGGVANDLIATFPLTEVPEATLDAFVGQAAGGTWQLTVRDVLSQDTGRLVRWSLDFLDPLPASTVSFSGQVSYDDQPLTSAGVGATRDLPVRFADLEVFRVSDGQVFDRGQTDANGSYSLQVPSAGVQALGLRVYAAQASAQHVVQVKDNATTSAMYSLVVTSDYDTSVAVSQNLNADESGPAAGVFNIFDQAIVALDEIRSRDGAAAPKLTLFWEPGTSDGTFFTTVDDSVHLLGIANDPDEFDDDVILHEIGHFAAAKLSKDDSPGGPHSPSESHQDPRLSWSEGWANYFSSAVRADPEYLDFSLAGVTRFDLEGPTSPTSARGQDSENTVQATLWDVADGAGSSDDTPGVDDDVLDLPDGFQRVWDVFTNQFPSSQDAILETFRNGWPLEHGAGFRTAELETILAGFEVDLDRDNLFTRTPGLATGDATLTDQVTVTRNLRVEEVNLFLDLTHSLPQTLTLVLRAPGGQSVTLFNQDQAPGLLPARASAPGFFDWFQDFEQISFQSLDGFDGISAIGAWTLEIQDPTDGAPGTLRRWSLDVRGDLIGFPDLEATQVTGPGSAVAGGTASVDVRVENTSPDAAASAFQVSVYLSEDRTITDQDTLLTSYTVGGLTSGQADQRTVSPVIPPATASGVYFVGVLVDDLANVAEGDETNNVGVATVGTSLSPSSNGTNLFVTSLTAPTSALSPGTISVTSEVVNAGTDAAGEFRLGYFLSPDPAVDLTDLFLGEVIFSSLAGLGSVQDSRSLSIPPGVLDGSYTLGTVVDFTLAVDETDEADNVTTAPARLLVTRAVDGIDLQPVSVTGPAGGVLGQAFTVAVEVRNGGDTASPAFTIQVLVTPSPGGGTTVAFDDFVKALLLETSDRTDPTPVNGLAFLFDEDPTAFDCVFTDPPSCQDGLALATITVGGLAPGESVVQNVSVVVPTAQPAGPYLVLARVDPSNDVPEGDEGNNQAVSAQAVDLIPPALPDLDPLTLIGPSVVAQGQQISLTRTITNAGSGTAAGWSEEYFLIPGGGTTIGADAVSLGVFAGPTLGAGLGDSRTRTLSIPLSTPVSQAVRFALRADSTGALVELDEANNEVFAAATSSVTTNGALPDLIPVDFEILGVPTTPGTTPLVTVGTQVTFRATVQNVGPLLATTATTAQLILSSDDLIGVPPDQVLASFDIPLLATNSVFTREATVTIPTTVTTGIGTLALVVDAFGALTELSEANNTLISTGAIEIETAVLGVDLRVAQIEEPFAATPGTTMVVDLLLVNRGRTGTPNSYTTRIFLSTDQTLDAGDVVISPDLVTPGMAPLAQVPLRARLQLPGSVGAGPFFLIAQTDLTGAVAEEDETNNISVTENSFFTGPPIAELILTDITVDPLSVAQGGRFDVRSFFENVGTAAIPTTFSIGFQLTTDSDVGPFVTIGTVVQGPMGIGETVIRDDEVLVPLDQEPDGYELCVRIDFGNDVPENGTGINALCQLGVSVTEVSEPPDYVPTAINLPLGGYQGGETFLSRRIENRGQTDATTSSRTGYFLSFDETFSPDDVSLGTDTVAPIPRSGNDQRTVTLQIPTGVAAGTYSVFVVADLDDEIGDGAPLNNVALAETKFEVFGSPDLVFTTLTAPLTVVAGQDLQVTREITNQGDGAEILSFTNRYYLSLDSTFDPDDFLLGVDSLSFLAAGASDLGVVFFPTPAHLSPGSYFLFGVVDAADQSEESDEGNNLTTSPNTVSVSGAVDLEAVSVTADTTGTTGTPITIVSTVRNVGNLSLSTPFDIDFYLSTDQTADATDVIIDGVTINQTLDPRGELVLTSVFPIPDVTAGDYFVYMDVDPGDAVAESDESTTSNQAFTVTTFTVFELDGTPPAPQVSYLDGGSGFPVLDPDFIGEGLLLIRVDFGEALRTEPLLAIDADFGPDLPPTVMTRLSPDGRVWVLGYDVERHDGVSFFDGPRVISISRAEDLAGNPAAPIAGGADFFSVDTRPPTLVFGALPDGSLYSGASVNLSGSTADSSPVEVKLSVSRGPFTTTVPFDARGAFTINGVPSLGPELDVQLMARDRAGNFATSQLRTYFQDSDSDGLSDLWERLFTDPDDLTVLASGQDTDLDGLNDEDEFTFGTNPLNQDTDGDGILDGPEVFAGTDPVNAGNEVPVAVADSDSAGPPRLVTLTGAGSTDANGDPLTFSWSQSSPSTPFIQLDSFTAISPKGRFLKAGTYVHALEVRDGKITSPPDTVTTVVSNLGPEARARYVQVLQAGTTSVLDASGSRDPNTDQVNHNWVEAGSNPVGGRLSNLFIKDPTVTAPAAGAGEGTYVFTDTTDDASLTTPSPAVVTQVVLSSGRTPPRADPGPDLRVDVGVPTTLDARGSRDPDQLSATLTYSWSPAAGNPPGATFQDPGPLGAARPVFTAALPGIYRYRLTVTDADGLVSPPATLELAAGSPSFFPVPVAPEVSAQPGDRVQLDASASIGPAGRPLSFSWTQTAGVPVLLDDANTARPSFLAPHPGDYRFRLVVTADQVNSRPLEVVARVVGVGDGVPTAVVRFDLDGNPISDFGRPRAGNSVRLDARLSSDDDALAFSWRQLEGPWVALEDAQSPRPRLFPQEGTYRFEVTVSDGRHEDRAEVSFSVDGNNRAPIVVLPETVSAITGQLATLSASGTVDPDAETLTFLWTQLTGQPVNFSGQGGPVIQFQSNVDGSYTFQVRVFDGFDWSVTRKVTVVFGPLVAAGGGGGAGGGAGGSVLPNIPGLSGAGPSDGGGGGCAAGGPGAAAALAWILLPLGYTLRRRRRWRRSTWARS